MMEKKSHGKIADEFISNIKCNMLALVSGFRAPYLPSFNILVMEEMMTKFILKLKHNMLILLS